ncbi:MAG: SusC/RagA family TonB-linked outer membrane protein [Saprospiraceae bacterium]
MKQKFYSKFLLLSLLVLPGFLAAQRTVTGKVTDSETGETLLGVTVQVVGTTTGGYTDIDGNYTVNVPDGSDQLRFAYTGYTEQTVTLGASNVMDVSLVSGALLNEIVVIGYGTVKKEDVTGALLEVGPEQFNKGAINAPQELIVGKVAGVQVTPSADPGGGGNIRIRGGSSLSAINDPLIVIDGVPVDDGVPGGSRSALNIINPNDIATFTVLKDASATAIYGSRASNGVILITTKKGKLGSDLSVSYNGNVSFSDRLNEIDVYNGDEFRALINERYADGHPARDILGTANTDWQSEIFQQGIGQDHNVSFQGSAGILPYRMSVGYTNRNGVLKTDNFERFSGALNLSPGFFNNTLQLNFNLKEVVNKNVFGNRGAIGAAVSFDPTQPVYSGNDAFGGYYTSVDADGNPNTIAIKNPLALLEQHQDESSVERFLTNLQADYRFWFLPELRANLNLGYDRSKGAGFVFEPVNAAFAFTNGGYDKVYNQTKTSELLEFYLNYVKNIGNNTLDIMGGYSWQHFDFADFNSVTNVAGTTVLEEADVNSREYYLLSLFGRVNLNLGSRVLLTGTVRRDGTSRFSPDNRWGLFPAAAVAFKILEEKPGALNSLKLRLSYGETGQQAVSDNLYPYLARYVGSTGSAQYQLGNNFITTIRPDGYDANIKWEQTTTYNVGLDYAMFNSRVYGSLEYYVRQTSDLINFIPVPAGTNLTNFITTNVGDLENRGVELSLNLVAMQSDRARWEIGGNLTMNENKITKLTALEDPEYQGVFTGDISGGVGNKIQIHSVGFPANSFFVYEQVYDDNGTPIEGLYVDRNNDGQITPDDRYRFKDPNPDFLIGFYSSYTRGNLDFSFGGRANIGNYMYNNIQSEQGYYNRLYNSTNYLSNAITETTAIDFTNPEYFSDHFIQNASFLRFDHITLGYTFNSLNKINRLRVYGSVQNPILVTDYTGLDPEVFNGIDGNIYPRSRTIVIGVNADF